MHLPDHYLDPSTCVATAALAATGLVWGAPQARHCPRPSGQLLAGVSTGIFAAQLLNFPVESGTSGHLVGGALAGILLGPGLGIWAVSMVLVVQCLVFGDGGLAALGANILNMAIAGPLVGSLVFRGLAPLNCTAARRSLAAAVAAWCSVMAGAALCALELTAAGRFAAEMVFPAMLGVHALIGISEALVTVAVVALVARASPDALHAIAPTTLDSQKLTRASRFALVAAAALTLFAPLACTWPDGLDSVLSRLGSAPMGAAANGWSPLVDYVMPGIHWAPLATILAASIGLVLVYLMAWLAARPLVAPVRQFPRKISVESIKR